MTDAVMTAQEREANKRTPAACGCCGGWTSFGGCSSKADTANGCICEGNVAAQKALSDHLKIQDDLKAAEKSRQHKRERDRRARVALVRRVIEELHMSTLEAHRTEQDKREIGRAASMLDEVLQHHFYVQEADA